MTESVARRFQRKDDEIVVELPEIERKLLRHLLPQLRELLMAGDDPTLRRLRPPARPDDADAERSYRELVDDDILLARLEAIEVVENGIDGAHLDPDGVAAWMHSLNALRLVLGERLAAEGVDLADTVEHDHDDEHDDDHELSPVLEIFEWMGWVLGDLVNVAQGTLPET